MGPRPDLTIVTSCCVWTGEQAFKSYDEAGAMRRIQCLKYLVLATMLMESEVDPFDAQEAAPYKQDPEVWVPRCPHLCSVRAALQHMVTQ